uniref:DNA (cytosine-5-)-methyltransferase n=1 Tax=viral metagenome TaxID=1070528 RepID=A0A6M3XYS4_9ZZZZ
MKILSLFDGISIAQQAFKELGFEVEYYASEIDKQAISITQKNHPNTEQLGDVKEIDTSNGYLHYGKGKLAETDIYFLIGGSPCQDLSIAKNKREGLNGKRSGLFWDYVRILKDLKPKYFVLENVASMPKEAKQTITETLWDIEPIMINASLVSAQNRKRLFWVGKLADKRHIGHWDSADYEKVNISQPHDEGILLKDILETEVDEKYFLNNDRIKYVLNRPKQYAVKINPEKTNTLRTNYGNASANETYVTQRVGQIGKGGQGDRIYSPEGKSVGLSALGGGRRAKMGLYAVGITKGGTFGNRKTIRSDKAYCLAANPSSDGLPMTEINNTIIRKLTPIECERLQSLPDNYTEGISNTQKYKTLGNGFNCAVIKHIIKSIL